MNARVFCLGGAGRIAREAVLDLTRFGNFQQITIADNNPAALEEVARLCNPARVDCLVVDVRDHDALVAAMRGYDIVMDGTTISLNRQSTHAIAVAGCHGVNLNGFGEEYAFSDLFSRNRRVHVAGFGMTPGITNLLAAHAASLLDSVDTVRISHGAFRPIAFSRSIAETTTYEYDPNLDSRVVFENGQFIQVPPFARPLEVELPPPYGTHTQYIIPHSETRTLARFLAPKGVKLIEVRGTWPPRNMRLIRALYEYGLLANPEVRVGESRIRVLDAIAEHLLTSTPGTTTDLYGYALHVHLTGVVGGVPMSHTFTHTHPASDGSVPEWAGLRAYTRCVGIPLAIAVHLIASGNHIGYGVQSPEELFDPQMVFAELERRAILIHHH